MEINPYIDKSDESDPVYLHIEWVGSYVYKENNPSRRFVDDEHT